MKDLIEALQILLKYGNPTHPFQCEHDELMIWGICPADVKEEDRIKLFDLGIFVHEDLNCFMSYRFASA